MNNPTQNFCILFGSDEQVDANCLLPDASFIAPIVDIKIGEERIQLISFLKMMKLRDN